MNPVCPKCQTELVKSITSTEYGVDVTGYCQSCNVVYHLILGINGYQVSSTKWIDKNDQQKPKH